MCKECYDLYRKENRDRILEQRRKNYAMNYKEKYREYRKKNKDRIRQSKQENKQKYNERTKIRHKERYHSDIEYRLRISLRNRLNKVITRDSKKASVLKLVGCGLHELKLYLESKFTEGMTWNNYGKWHIDHIKPCCSFDLTDFAQQKQCFHYTNLQPLWAKDNISKGGRI